MIFDEDFPKILEQVEGIGFGVVTDTIIHPGRTSFDVWSAAHPGRMVRFVGCPNHGEVYHLVILGTMAREEDISKIPNVSILGTADPELCEQVPYARDSITLMTHPNRVGEFLRTLCQ